MFMSIIFLFRKVLAASTTRMKLFSLN